MKVKCEVSDLVIEDLGIRLRNGETVTINDDLATKSRDLSRCIKGKFVSVLRFKEYPTIVIQQVHKDDGELQRLVSLQQEQIQNTNSILGKLYKEIEGLKENKTSTTIIEKNLDFNSIVSNIVSQLEGKVKDIFVHKAAEAQERAEKEVKLIPIEVFKSIIDQNNNLETNISSSTVKVEKESSIKNSIDNLKLFIKNEHGDEK